jgi:hypothetical protein
MIALRGPSQSADGCYSACRRGSSCRGQKHATARSGRCWAARRCDSGAFAQRASGFWPGGAGSRVCSGSYNNPLNKTDPLGLRSTDYDFATLDVDYLLDLTSGLPGWAQAEDPFGVLAADGFPFKMFNTWHRAVQLDLAGRVGGRIECFIRGAGANPDLRGSRGGYADVCTDRHIWEVKYFGETALDAALGRLARYQRNTSREPGRIVPPSIVKVGSTQLVAFSPAMGVRLYMPVHWFPVLERSPGRAQLLNQHVTAEQLLEAFVQAGTIPNWALDGGGDLPWEDIAAVGMMTLAGAAIVGMAVGCGLSLGLAPGCAA